MQETEKPQPGKKRLIACRVFESALHGLRITSLYPDLILRYLPAHLHLRPRELRRRLCAEISSARREGDIPCCAYGACFPTMDETLEKLSVPRISYRHCFEALLGRKRFEQISTDSPGSFFIEKTLLTNFEDSCWKPLELEDPLMRKWIFENYRQLVYILQPTDPPLEVQAGKIASRLNLSMVVVEADYTELKQDLIRCLEGANDPG